MPYFKTIPKIELINFEDEAKNWTYRFWKNRESCC